MYLKKIEQACSNSGGLVYASQKIEQACSISKWTYIYMSPHGLVQACINLKFLSKL